MSAPSSNASPSLDQRALLYVLGSGLWLAFSAASTRTFPFSTTEGFVTGPGIVQALCFAMTFFVIGGFERTRGPMGRYTLVKIAVVSCVAAYALGSIGSVCHAEALLYIASVPLAIGRACGFCQWLRMLALFNLEKAKLVLILGSVVEIILTFVIDLLGAEGLRSLAVFGACAPLGLAMLALNVRLHPSEYLDQPRTATIGHKSTTAAAMGPFKELPLPIVCAMALTLITPIASTVFGSVGHADIANGLLVPLSHSCALVILSALWFLLHKSITLPQLYCVFLPVFASIIFALSLAHEGPGWLVLFLGNGGYFFVSLLMVVTCLEVARHHDVRVLPLYGVIAGCVYLTDAMQLVLEGFMQNGTLNMEPYIGALLLLYVLMIPVFFIVAPLVSKHSREIPAAGTGLSNTEPPSTAPAQNATDAPDRCSRIAERHGLSKRQLDVMRYLAAGRDVNHIANALGLAPNTVRSYRKSLYAALGIHGQQELLDLIERETTGTP